MKLFINLKGRAFSTNAAYNKNHSLSAAARRWKLEMHKQISHYVKDCGIFDKSFDVKKHAIKATVVNRMPNLHTLTDGRISHQSGDVDNLNKLTLDAVFAYLPSLDDCSITHIDCSKVYAKDYSIEVTLEIYEFEKPDLED